jgi:DNA-binding MarR family transcriptional regulator
LGDEERRAWQCMVATFLLLDSALGHQLQQESGLSTAHFRILSRLAEAPKGSMHMSDLAITTSSSQSRLSHAVARLEEQGWALRTKCPENGRAVHATLTKSGFRILRDAVPVHVREVRRLFFDNLTREQVRQLITIFSRTLKVLSDEGYAIPPEATVFGRRADLDRLKKAFT